MGPSAASASVHAGEAKRQQAVGRPLKSLDVPLMILSALISLDMVGQISSFGGETFTWLVVLGFLWMIPYGLITAELGSAFPAEGGLYEWVKLAFGPLAGCVASIMYWSINPLWIGGSLAFISAEAWRSSIQAIAEGGAGDFLFKAAFVLGSFAITALPLVRAVAIFRLGTYLKLLLTTLFLISTVIYGLRFGFRGLGVVSLSPTLGGFLGLVPLLLFSLVGFEVPSQAGDEMQDPQRDVPRGVALSGVVGLLVYALPILALLSVLPPSAITGVSGFMAAVRTVFAIYGAAAPVMHGVAVVAFVASLAITGAAWAAAANRALAVAAGDGAFFPFFAEFDREKQTPVRVAALACGVSLAFMAAGFVFSRGDGAATFAVVLSIATSTSMLALLFVFPAFVRLRFTHRDTARPYVVPGGLAGMAGAALLATIWVALGSWVTVFPGTLETLFGLDYPFAEHWGVSRVRFEAFTLGTLGVLLAVGLCGFSQGRRRRTRVAVSTEAA